VLETIEDIGTHFRQVGLTAVRIGQSLSSTESQRQKAEHAQNLLEYFMAFDTLRYENMVKDAESERIEMLSHDKLGPLIQEHNYSMASEVSGCMWAGAIAFEVVGIYSSRQYDGFYTLQILSDLTIVCEDLNAPHMENAVKNIRVFAGRLEKKLLDRFESAAMGSGDAPDVATMRDCATCLLQFGDAVKVYNTYIYTIVAKQFVALR